MAVVVAAAVMEDSVASPATTVAIREKFTETEVGLVARREMSALLALNGVGNSLRNTMKGMMCSRRHAQVEPRPRPAGAQQQPVPNEKHPNPRHRSQICSISAMSLSRLRPSERHLRLLRRSLMMMTTLTTSSPPRPQPLSRRSIHWQLFHHRLQRRPPRRPQRSLRNPSLWHPAKVRASTTSSAPHRQLHPRRLRSCRHQPQPPFRLLHNPLPLLRSPRVRDTRRRAPTTSPQYH